MIYNKIIIFIDFKNKMILDVDYPIDPIYKALFAMNPMPKNANSDDWKQYLLSVAYMCHSKSIEKDLIKKLEDAFIQKKTYNDPEVIDIVRDLEGIVCGRECIISKIRKEKKTLFDFLNVRLNLGAEEYFFDKFNGTLEEKIQPLYEGLLFLNPLPWKLDEEYWKKNILKLAYEHYYKYKINQLNDKLYYSSFTHKTNNKTLKIIEELKNLYTEKTSVEKKIFDVKFDLSDKKYLYMNLVTHVDNFKF